MSLLVRDANTGRQSARSNLDSTIVVSATLSYTEMGANAKTAWIVPRGSYQLISAKFVNSVVGASAQDLDIRKYTSPAGAKTAMVAAGTFSSDTAIETVVEGFPVAGAASVVSTGDVVDILPGGAVATGDGIVVLEFLKLNSD